MYVYYIDMKGILNCSAFTFNDKECSLAGSNSFKKDNSVRNVIWYRISINNNQCLNCEFKYIIIKFLVF